MNPKRIQRQRTKGWQMPPNTVYVGRPSRWGNPFTVRAPLMVYGYSPNDKYAEGYAGQATPDQIVLAYRGWLEIEMRRTPGMLDELHDKDLACWCALDQPCHADVLLELANR